MLRLYLHPAWQAPLLPVGCCRFDRGISHSDKFPPPGYGLLRKLIYT
jgi:hypothetical protein